MKRRARKVLVHGLLGAVFCGGATVIWNIECFDVSSSNRYSNLEQARVDGAIERGWLPKCIPSSAHDIVEAHNIDTNQIFVSFQYYGNDGAQFIAACMATESPHCPSAQRALDLAPWWSPALVDDPGTRLPADVRIYHCKKMIHAGAETEAYVALNSGDKRAWYWTRQCARGMSSAAEMSESGVLQCRGLQRSRNGRVSTLKCRVSEFVG